MIVELKKLKITKSIFSQLMSLNALQFENYTVLGWVFVQGRNVILQHKEDKTLVKWKIVQDLKIAEDDPKRVYCNINGKAWTRRFLFTQDATDYCRAVNIIQTEARLNGQIFI